MTTTRRDGRREITEPVDLCAPDGKLDEAAVGWSRRPLHRSNLRGRGRTKRWEYWCVQTPETVLGLTVSDLDYAALCAIWALDMRDPARLHEAGATRLVPLHRVPMPDRCGGGPVVFEREGFSITVTPTTDGAHLSARSPEVSAEVTVTRPYGHESLGVVVPWSRRRFQYTVKQNTLPARGEVRLGERTIAIDGADAWATLDHGRGRWPYRVTWYWGAGSGRVRHAGHERVLGIQVGGAWTDGTGSTENALTLDGRLYPLHEDLRWDYDPDDWLSPWHVRAPSGTLDLELRPLFDRADRTQLGVLFNDTHQCFGSWHGTVRVGSTVLDVDGIRGWAEQVRNRW